MQLVIEEIKVPAKSVLAGRTLQETDLRNRTGAVIAASIESDGKMTYNPGGSNLILAGSTLVVLGERSALEKLSEIVAEEV
jgi:TrkA domain protein